MKDDNFVTCMNSVEKSAWLSFKEVVQNFLGNNRDPNYKTIVPLCYLTLKSWVV